MPSIVYCDNKDCLFYNDECERCDVDKLAVEHGVCAGSAGHGRNVSENDLDERLMAENEKLRELVRDMWHDGMCDCDERYTCAECEYGYHKRMEELGIEVDG